MDRLTGSIRQRRGRFTSDNDGTAQYGAAQSQYGAVRYRGTDAVRRSTAKCSHDTERYGTGVQRGRRRLRRSINNACCDCGGGGGGVSAGGGPGGGGARHAQPRAPGEMAQGALLLGRHLRLLRAGLRWLLRRPAGVPHGGGGAGGAGAACEPHPPPVRVPCHVRQEHQQVHPPADREQPEAGAQPLIIGERERVELSSANQK
eukprot:1195295-Prorocentrum_minimum.AAC.7